METTESTQQEINVIVPDMVALSGAAVGLSFSQPVVKNNVKMVMVIILIFVLFIITPYFKVLVNVICQDLPGIGKSCISSYSVSNKLVICIDPL